MASRGLNELFDCYRRTRDPDALAELFDRTAPRLLRVARHLATDRGAAEDIVQATFLAVIESAERFDPARPLLPWLMGILTNQIRLWRRGSRQELDPERLRSEPVADPIAAAAAAELRVAARRAIGELPRSCRPALRLTLEHGLNAREIAARLRRPSGTVRSQLARGMARLRRLLPRGFAPALSLPAVPDLAAVRAHVLQRAAGGAGSGAMRSFFAGALIMKQTLAVVLTLALALAAWWMATGGAWRPETAVLATAPGVPVQAPGDASAERWSLPGASPGRTGDFAAPAEAELHVRVAWHDATPAADVQVELLPVDRPDAALHARVARTAADATTVFAGVPPGRVLVVGDRGGEVAVELSAGQRSAATLTIPAGLDLDGRVTTAAGAPIGGAAIWISGRDLRAGIAVAAHTDPEGRFLVRSLASGRLVAATAPGFAPGTGEEVRGEAGRTRRLTLVLKGRGGSLTGRVTDPAGQAVAGAFVVVGETVGMGHFERSFDTAYCYPTAHWLRTDAEGRFRADGVAPGMPVPVRARAAGFAGWEGSARVPAGGAESLAITLARGSTITGRVLDDGGRTIAGARVQAWAQWAQYRAAWADTHAIADTEGCFVLAGLGSGSLSLDVTSPDGLQVKQRLPVGEGQTMTWNPILVRGLELRGRVVTENGEPLARLRVSATATRRDPSNTMERRHHVESVADEAGRFVLRQCEARPYEVLLHEDGTWYSHYRAGTREPGSGEHPLVFPEGSRPTCSIRGRVLGPDGGPAQDARICVSPDPNPNGSSAFLRADPDTGAFVTPRFPPGRYVLCVSATDHPNWRQVHTLVAGQSFDVGTIRMQRQAVLFVSLPVSGPVARGIEYQLRGRTRGWAGSGSVDKAPLRVPCLAPDRYVVSLWGGQLPLTHLAFELAEGEERDLRPALSAAVDCRLRLRIEGRDPGSILLVWRTVAGDVVWSEDVYPRDRSHQIERRLAPGTWRVEARVGEQIRGECRFTLDAGAAAEPVELVVR